MNALRWEYVAVGNWGLFLKKEFGSVLIRRRHGRYYVDVSQPIPEKYDSHFGRTVGHCRTLAGAKAFALGLRFAPNRHVLQRNGCVANYG
jgi:hypothetical protein